MHYEKRIIIAVEKLSLAQGSLANVHLQHENRCPILRGKPCCNCSPEIFIETDAGRIEVLQDGSIRPIGHRN